MPDGTIYAKYGTTPAPLSTSSTAEEAKAILMVMQDFPGCILHVHTDSLNCIQNFVRIRVLASIDFKSCTERALWRQIAKETARTDLTLHKVDGHTGVWGNELADKVADLGVEYPVPQTETRRLVFDFADAQRSNKEFKKGDFDHLVDGALRDNPLTFSNGP